MVHPSVLIGLRNMDLIIVPNNILFKVYTLYVVKQYINYFKRYLIDVFVKKVICVFRT